TARRLAGATGILAAISLIGTGVLMSPGATDAAYYGHHTPSLPHLAPYAGSVVDASIDELEIPHGRLPASDAIRARLRGDFTLRVNARAGAPPDALAALLLVTDADQNEILLLGPSGEDLVYRYWTRGRAIGLETATVRLPRALAQIGVGSAFELRV